MKIVTWNINGIRARLPIVLNWLKKNQPDILGLQEIKCLEENFPKMEFEDLGYNVEILGQKGFNGVALLSKLPFDEITYGFEGSKTATLEKEQARLIEGVFSTENGVVWVCNIYLPNGNPVNNPENTGTFSDKFTYKLNWMNRLNEFVKERLTYEEPFILMGDFNIIPSPIDCHNPKAWWGDALYRTESQEKFRTLSNMGMVDALRAVSEEPNYSFWDFQAGAWRKNSGIRIDFLMLSPQAVDNLEYVKTHSEARALERPSDHVPIEGGFSFRQT